MATVEEKYDTLMQIAAKTADSVEKMAANIAGLGSTESISRLENAKLTIEEK